MRGLDLKQILPDSPGSAGPGEMKAVDWSNYPRPLDSGDPTRAEEFTDKKRSVSRQLCARGM